MHRPRPCGQGSSNRHGHVVTQSPGRSRPKRQLGQGRGHRNLIEFLKRTLPILCERGVAGQKQHRTFGPARGIQRPERVCRTRRRGDHANPDFPGQLRPGDRHEHRGRLVPRMNDLDPGVDACVVQRHDLVARQGKYLRHARRRQRLHQQVRTSRLLHSSSFHPRLPICTREAACLRKPMMCNCTSAILLFFMSVILHDLTDLFILDWYCWRGAGHTCATRPRGARFLGDPGSACYNGARAGRRTGMQAAGPWRSATAPILPSFQTLLNSAPGTGT